MPRVKHREPEPTEPDQDEATAARDATMARLAACRSSLAAALATVDEALDLFVEPEDDKKGTKRCELLESIDDLCGAAASSVQQAQAEFANIDPTEGEPGSDE